MADSQKVRAARYYARHHTELNLKSSTYKKSHLEEVRAYQTQYNELHREEKRAKAAEYRARSPEKRKAAMAKYRDSHRDKIASSDKMRADKRSEYKKLHPETTREHNYRRRVRLQQSFVAPVSVQEIYDRDRGVCQICRKPVELQVASLDHIIPVAHGGAHAPWNVQLSHRSCNYRRGTGRTPIQTRLAI